LEAVLQSVTDDAPDEIWCLGDLVGYGPRPNECCALIRERADVCLIGNHDLGVLGRIDLDDFSPDAAMSARWTAGVLEDGPRSYLEQLESTGVRAGVGLFHASPRDPVWEYVLSPPVALAALAGTEQPVVLVGHSHVALVFGWEQRTLALAPEGIELDLADERWLLNPGSVGQPRDGDPRAAWLVLDLDGSRAHFRRTEYAVERTQEEIREAGLPEPLAARLEHGI
jgi:diadenosine tetraphosphatase ApaH/serine/threonine PP2A family protein phosphatase